MLEEAAIKEAIMEYYHEGHVQYVPELYDEILHDDWRFFWWKEDGEFEIVTKDTYKSWYNPKDKDEELEWNTEILDIDITGNNAAVKLRIGNQRVEFTDYFHMIKKDGRWWVVNKLSTAKRFEES
jgi:hypothetical protein